MPRPAPNAGHAQVILFRPQARKPRDRLRPPQLAVACAKEMQIRLIVALSDFCLLPMGAQLLQGKLTQRLQQQKALLAARSHFHVDEALACQRAQGSTIGIRHPCRCLQVKATGKDAQGTPERALLFRQQVVAVFDGGAQGALAGRQIMCAVHQQIQAARLQLREQLSWRQQVALCGAQLDCQRQAVQALADRLQSGTVDAGDSESRVNGRCALGKQGQCVVWC